MKISAHFGQTAIGSEAQGRRTNRHIFMKNNSVLALGELEASPRSLASIFLAFFAPWISGQKTLPAQRCAHISADLKQRNAAAMSHSSCLPDNAATLALGNDIKTPDRINRLTRLRDQHFQHLSANILIHRHAIDGNVAFSGWQPHLGSSIFSMTRSVVSRDFFQCVPPASGVGRS